MTQPSEKDQVICLLKAEIQDLQDQLDGQSIPSPECLDDLNVQEMLTRMLSEAMRRSGGSKTIAARLLGIDRTTLHRWLGAQIKRSHKWSTKCLSRSSPAS